ncbi:MAG: hypothetical protein ACLVGR_06610 [Anaerovoracaceae bacterium]
MDIDRIKRILARMSYPMKPKSQRGILLPLPVSIESIASGWILIVGMACLGVSLKFIPGLPAEFIASFYSGLGPMLILAACRFIFKSFIP